MPLGGVPRIETPVCRRASYTFYGRGAALGVVSTVAGVPCPATASTVAEVPCLVTASTVARVPCLAVALPLDVA